MSGLPDFKSAPRIVDRTATKRALLTHPSCAACGAAATNGHHVLPVGRGQSGDDCVADIVGLCGTGSTGCHGAWHGSPYIHQRPGLVPERMITERRDAEWVARRIGAHLLAERPDTIAYVLEKLGATAGWDFLRRRYFIEQEAA